jgi:hypothetical protein
MRRYTLLAVAAGLGLLAGPAAAEPFFFSTGNPDGLIGTLSRPAGAGHIQTETADDFVLSKPTHLTSATFTGLLPTGAPLSSVTRVEVEFYHVFPKDSTIPPSGNVPQRANSPADVEIKSATRDSADGSLSFRTSLLNPSFGVANTVVDGINKSPKQFTSGEGPARGEEVQFNVTFNPGVDLAADHFFFRPEVELSDGEFLWLSAARPIVPPGTPLGTDLQTWIRNDDLAPDWLRVGTDITHQGPFNASFSLTGVTPEPASLTLLGLGALGLAGYGVRRRRQKASA